MIVFHEFNLWKIFTSNGRGESDQETDGGTVTMHVTSCSSRRLIHHGKQQAIKSPDGPNTGVPNASFTGGS